MGAFLKRLVLRSLLLLPPPLVMRHDASRYVISRGTEPSPSIGCFPALCDASVRGMDHRHTSTRDGGARFCRFWALTVVATLVRTRMGV
jgi:hypothetical protein